LSDRVIPHGKDAALGHLSYVQPHAIVCRRKINFHSPDVYGPQEVDGDVERPLSNDRTFVRLPVRAGSDNYLHHAAGRDDSRNERVPAMKWIQVPCDKLQILALRANQLRPVPVEPFPGKPCSVPRRTWIIVGLILLPLLLCAGLILRLRAQDASHDAAYYAKNPAEMLSGYRHVEVASVSDAEEQLYGQRMYMSHRMQSLFPAKFAGYALTVLLAKQENHDPDALNGMLEAIDSGKPDSVYVMSIEDGENIAGMGGLMGTAMSARNFSGAVIDGHCAQHFRQPLSLRGPGRHGYLRRRDGCGRRHYHCRPGRSCGGTAKECSGGADSRAATGLRRALDVLVDREAEVDYRCREAVPPFVISGNLLPITQSQSVFEPAGHAGSRDSEQTVLD
jgi:hypothetical protein